MSEIYLICGSGGVGKTTVSASLGLKFALAGKKTIVLTVDPARRLATSLGLRSLSDKPRRIDLRDQNIKGHGELYAMMMDTKRTFDRIVTKHAKDDEAANRILENPIYKHLSNMLAGSQEYMAMERLYEIWDQQKYDVIVVDTPPVQNAVDFLEAPQKMSAMISNSMLDLFLKPAMSMGRKGFGLFEKGSQKILEVMDKIIGVEFLRDLSEMLVAFKELLSGFDERAKAVTELLSRRETQFFTVCTTGQASIEETLFFAQRLEALHYHLSKTIVNRVYAGEEKSKKTLDDELALLNKSCDAHTADVLFKNYKRFVPLITRDNSRIKKLSKRFGTGNITTIPLFLTDVHDLEGLKKIAEYL